MVTAFCQTVYTFTNAGQTGRFGPSQTQTNAAYASTNLNEQVITTNGIQYWTVPAEVNSIRIEAYGAKGGNANSSQGGSGAKMQGDFSVTPGQVLKILVGQSGTSTFDYYAAASGGGGTFVSTNTNTPLIVAGGGSGATGYSIGKHGQITQNGYSGDGCSSVGTTGYGGADGTFCGQGTGGGGGFYGDGQNTTYWAQQFGYGFVNGGYGGITLGSQNLVGGFGGGAGTFENNTSGGPGGGYTGGSSAQHGNGYSGGGGSSFNSGTNQVNQIGFNNGNGYVVITNLFSVNISQTAFNCNGTNNGSITANPSGGQAPYTFLWSNGQTTQTISNLAPGTYSVNISDNLGQTAVNTITIADPVINSSIVGTDFVCSNGSIPNKTVTSIQYRIMMSYTYGDFINFTINGNSVGYFYTQYDFNCYESVQTYTVTNPIFLNLISNGNNTFVYNTYYAYYFGWVKAVLTFSDGSTQTVIISDPTGQAATEGNYTCSSGNPYSSPVTANISLTSTFSPFPGTLNLTTTQPSAYTYLWETGATTEDIVVSTPGYYTVTINQAEYGYSLTDSVFVTGPTNTITPVITTDTCGLTNSGAIDVSISGFTLPVSYSWNTGATSQDLNNIPSGNYTLTVIDASGYR